MNTKNFSITLRAKDYDRYLATKFLPENCQENLAKWYLWWQSVTAQLKASEDPMPQIIRLQWWKEQLENSELTKENQEFYALKSLLLEKNISTKSIVAALDAEQNWLELPAHERSLEKMQLWLYGREELVFSISQQIYTEQEKFPANAQEQKKLAHLLNAYGLVQYVRSGMSFSLPVGRKKTGKYPGCSALNCIGMKENQC
jgi:phytoene/squalene synthetase